MYSFPYWTQPIVSRLVLTIVVLEKTLESPLDCKEIQPVHSEGDQPWDFFGRNDAKAETPVLWPPHAKNWFTGKDSDAGRDWGQEEKGTTEDEMAGWHHWLDGRESEWTLGVGDGGRPGMLWFMGSQRVGHDWATELNWLIASWPAYSFQFSMFYLAQTHEHIVIRLFSPDRKLSSINSIHFNNDITYSPNKPFTFIFQIVVSSPEFEFILFATVCFFLTSCKIHLTFHLIICALINAF